MVSDYNLPRERSEEKSSIIRKKHTITKKQGSTIHYFKTILWVKTITWMLKLYLTILNELTSSPINTLLYYTSLSSKYLCVYFLEQSSKRKPFRCFLLATDELQCWKQTYPTVSPSHLQTASTSTSTSHRGKKSPSYLSYEEALPLHHPTTCIHLISPLCAFQTLQRSAILVLCICNFFYKKCVFSFFKSS